MGQKVNPRGLRLGIIEGWDSKWFAGHGYADLLHEDLRLRDFIKQRLYHAGISRIEIERMANKAKINIFTARPGIVIGKKGVEIEKLKTDIQKLMKSKEAFINIHEVRRPDLDPQLVAENIGLQLERRVAFRRAMKEAVTRAMRMGAQGVRGAGFGTAGGRRNRAPRMVPRGARPAPDAPRRCRLRLRGGQDHLRCDWDQGLGFSAARSSPARKRRPSAPALTRSSSPCSLPRKSSIARCRRAAFAESNRAASLAFGDFGSRRSRPPISTRARSRPPESR